MKVVILAPSTLIFLLSTPARVQIPQTPHMMRIVIRTGNRANTLNLEYLAFLENFGTGIQAFSRYWENKIIRTMVLKFNY